MSKFYTIVRCDDWLAIYQAGQSIYQGHSIDLDYFLQLLNKAGDVEFKSAYNWMDDEGGGWFPERLEEIEKFDE